MLTTKKKKDVIVGVQTHDSDTGSPQVQIALLSGRIKELTEHLKVHKKDIHSRRGLIKMVDTRRKLLRNFKNANFDAYQGLIQKLGLKK
ncbi:MAG: small subunit ribosomal protein S15 [Crocinitomicaceae bacterium]|jgi:small subunit ribosomal protein S15